MKFVEKFKLVKTSEPIKDSLERELSDYKYDGYVNFCEGPTCLYDLNNHLVLPFDINGEQIEEYYVVKDGKTVPTGINVKFLHMGTFQLRQNFGLQDIFDNNKDSIGIVFYVPQDHPGTIFHAGNRIRAAIIKKEYKEDNLEKNISCCTTVTTGPVYKNT